MSQVPVVVAVGLVEEHGFSKVTQPSIELVEGLGVAGDCHSGLTVQQLYRKKIRPAPPNLRQVHVMHAELFDEVLEAGHTVLPQQLGENITTRNLDLLNLPTGTLLRLGDQAVVEVTGLRHPCYKIENFQAGLESKMLARDDKGKLVRKSGIMGIVKVGGRVDTGAHIRVQFPDEPHRRMRAV